jgi:Fe-S-cluster-containing hydrogenase component 2
VDVCPTQALAQVAGKAFLAYPERCTYCSACEDVCPEDAIALAVSDHHGAEASVVSLFLAFEVFSDLEGLALIPEWIRERATMNPSFGELNIQCLPAPPSGRGCPDPAFSSTKS